MPYKPVNIKLYKKYTPNTIFPENGNRIYRTNS